MPFLNKIAVIGVGLIGGSAGIAALKKGAAGEVAGVARRQETIDAALSAGAVSYGTLDLEEGVQNADLVLVASPVASVPEIIKASLPYLKPGAVLTDAGSVKRFIVEEVEGFITGGVSFVGSHPVAGGEKSGVESADGGLFEGAVCVITPVKAQEKARNLVVKFWEMLGMRVIEMSPVEHDRMMAAASHLPHIASSGLVNAAEHLKRSGTGSVFISGGGFRDTTRIASASAALWKDIILYNRDNIAEGLKTYINILKRLESALAEGDGDYIFRFLDEAVKGRNCLMDTRDAEEK